MSMYVCYVLYVQRSVDGAGCDVCLYVRFDGACARCQVYVCIYVCMHAGVRCASAFMLLWVMGMLWYVMYAGLCNDVCVNDVCAC